MTTAVGFGLAARACQFSCDGNGMHGGNEMAHASHAVMQCKLHTVPSLAQDTRIGV